MAKKTIKKEKIKEVKLMIDVLPENFDREDLNSIARKINEIIRSI